MKSRPRLPQALWPVLAIGVLTLALGACGGSSSNSSSAATSAAGGGPGKTIDVTLKDFSITLAGGDSLAAGTYSFAASNQGPSAHNLTISGPGVSNQATPTFGPGQSETLTVTLRKGSYQFYCSVPGHKEAGMLDTITVS
jgi:plastocyanin